MENQLTAQLQEQLLNIRKEEPTRHSALPDSGIYSNPLAATPTKRSQSVIPSLSPSPKFREPAPKSKDDCSLNPRTPGRPSVYPRGLSLQMPTTDIIVPASASFQNCIPLSPQLDPRNAYGGLRASVLPRHSRGLDFSRACTNLHHSTLAEQSSPDSSPTLSQKMTVPPRKAIPSGMNLDPSETGLGVAWSTAGTPDKRVPPSLAGSVSMIDSGSSGSSSDDDELMEPDDEEDLILSTPQVSKTYGYTSATPSANASVASPGAVWANSFSPAVAGIMHFQRRKYRKNKSERSSSSASGHSTLACQSPVSPSVTKTIKTGGYFARSSALREAQSRRESLSMGTLDLHSSSGQDSADESRPPPSTPGVVRRVVTRRSNLLPKTKTFARVRATLLEESMPVDSEARREADVVRQVRESDLDHAIQTTPASPNLLATQPVLSDSLEDIPEENALGLSHTGLSKSRSLSSSFSRQASRNSSGTEFWNEFHRSTRTPPPPSFFPHGSSSDDISMDSPSISTPPSSLISHNVPPNPDPGHITEASQSSTPQAPPIPSYAELSRRINNKRRREDDFDDASIKRRGVSPGLSAHNSPVLAQSPAFREGNWWGVAKSGRERSISNSAVGDRSNSSASITSVTPAFGPKRVGLQGMTDTHDGLMKMSIE